jgi:hypothetical protein
MTLPRENIMLTPVAKEQECKSWKEALPYLPEKRSLKNWLRNELLHRSTARSWCRMRMISNGYVSIIYAIMFYVRMVAFTN